MPNRFTPINSKQNAQKAFQTINNNFMMLDAETYAKTISNGKNSQMVSGKLPNRRYGEVFYDAGGMPRILIGQAPGDGRPGIWITKEGFNVLDEVK
jgi:hypothetical protein